MKWFGFILFLIGTQSFAQTFEITQFTDSLIIRDANITANPFSFGEDPLAYLKKFKPKTEKELFENNHVAGKIDTIHHFTIGQDKFSIFQVSNENTWLLTSKVITSKFKTHQGIHVGNTKTEVIQLLKAYNLKTIPDGLVLENSEYYEYFLIRFKKEKVYSIEFSGYYD